MWSAGRDDHDLNGCGIFCLNVYAQRSWFTTKSILPSSTRLDAGMCALVV